jgi:hypothetical protein
MHGLRTPSKNGELLVKRQLIVVGCAILVGFAARADAVPLGDETLKQTLAGKTVHLDTPFGIAIPITYQANGLMSGKAGVLAFFLGAAADRGRWWVSEGKLCQKWFKWLDAQPSCMRLTQDGHRIAWRRDDGMSGTATIVAALPPGAEATPRGLGGPVDMELRPSVATAPPREPTRPTSISAPVASPPRATKSTVARAAVTPVQPQVRQSIDAGGQSQLVSAPRVVAVADGTIGAEQDYTWCRAPGFADAHPMSSTGPGAEPDLLLVARLRLAGSWAPQPTACLTAETAPGT